LRGESLEKFLLVVRKVAGDGEKNLQNADEL